MLKVLTLLVQVGLLVAIPFTIYKATSRSAKEIKDSPLIAYNSPVREDRQLDLTTIINQAIAAIQSVAQAGIAAGANRRKVILESQQSCPNGNIREQTRWCTNICRSLFSRRWDGYCDANQRCLCSGNINVAPVAPVDPGNGDDQSGGGSQNNNLPQTVSTHRPLIE